MKKSVYRFPALSAELLPPENGLQTGEITGIISKEISGERRMRRQTADTGREQKETGGYLLDNRMKRRTE